MTDPNIATAADYADAMLVARRAKSALVLLLLLMLLVQLGLFFTVRYSNVLAQSVESATQPVDGSALSARYKAEDLFHYLTATSEFLGIVFSIMLAAVLYLLTQIMLVGRLIGVARVTSAFVWSLLLILIIFPRQTFFGDASYHDTGFMIPGVLYSWSEVLQSARFDTGDWRFAMLKWTRFVAMPVITILLLLVIQIKSNRGLKQALGEDDLSALTGTNA